MVRVDRAGVERFVAIVFQRLRGCDVESSLRHTVKVTLELCLGRGHNARPTRNISDSGLVETVCGRRVVSP